MISMGEKIILVNEEDEKVSSEEKIKAHKDGGKLHRAFSVFIFNSEGKLLLQKRAENKYHSGGLWSNTCCSHPYEGESVKKAAESRLKAEMGFTCDLQEEFSFIYEADFDSGLTEKEFDHVLFGVCKKKPDPNPDEVSDWKWVEPEEVRKDAKENPGEYTPWFRKIIGEMVKRAKNKNILN